jgi:hypothetical protein
LWTAIRHRQFFIRTDYLARKFPISTGFQESLDFQATSAQQMEVCHFHASSLVEDE